MGTLLVVVSYIGNPLEVHADHGAKPSFCGCGDESVLPVGAAGTGTANENV